MPDRLFCTLPTGVIAAAIAVVGFVVSLLRVPFDQHDRVWAEDGNVFLFEAINSGHWNVLFEPYAGYQHLVPRLSAALILSFVPLGGYAVAVFLFCSAFTGLVAAAVFWLSRDVLSSVPARIVVSSVTFLLPLSSVEVIGNLADIHTYCMWLAPWIVFSHPSSRRGVVGWGVVAILCAMTEIQSVIFLPFLLFRLRRPSPLPGIIPAALALGAVAQVATTFMQPRHSSPAWPGIPSLVQGYLINVVFPFVDTFSPSIIARLMSSGVLIPSVALIPFAAAGIFALVFGDSKHRVIVIALVVGSLSIYAAGAIFDGTTAVRYEGNYTSTVFGGYVDLRYGVASGMMLAALLPIGISVLTGVHPRFDLLPRARRSIQAAGLVGLVGLVAVFTVVGSHTQSIRTADSWSGDVGRGLTQCRESPTVASIKLPVAPDRGVVLTCKQVEIWAQ